MNHSLNVLSFISSSPFCFGLDSNLAETGYSFSVGAEVAAATCGIYSKYLIKKTDLSQDNVVYKSWPCPCHKANRKICFVRLGWD